MQNAAAGFSRALEPRSHARTSPRTHGPSALPNGGVHARSLSGSSAGHRRGSALAREGIKPASSRATPGSQFGNAGKRRHSSDQSRTVATIQQRCASGSSPRKPGYTDMWESKKDQPYQHANGSPRRRGTGLLKDAEPLGDGWWLMSPRAAGKFQQCGLHRVIESNGAHRYLCAWEPRAPDVAHVLRSPSPAYNLEVHAKCMSTAGAGGPVAQQKLYVVFAIKSRCDFYSISADVGRKEWALERIEDGISTCIQAIGDASLRANIFYGLLLQVRGASVSLDANGVAVFTSVRLAELQSTVISSENSTSELMGLSGPLGVLAHSSKSAFKGWKVYCPKNAATNVPRKAVNNRNIVGNSHQSQQKGGAFGSQNAASRIESNHGTGEGGLRQHKIASFFDEDALLPRRFVGLSGDEPHIISQVEDDIIDRNLGTSFDDIAALAEAKRLLNEAIALPIMVPEFFTGIREPWKGVLLFGPPGTGKTMLAKAASAVNGSTFFNVSSSLLVSKFRGESEKIVRCLFNMARFYGPSIVFIDEVDAIASSRSSTEHEASRRLKTELFMQMDGITSSVTEVKPGADEGAGTGQVMVLATTNCPWNLDDAIRRRLEKRVYVPLPDLASRNDIFSINLSGMRLANDVRVLELADQTEGYSGADINLICREASMMPMRRLIADKNPEEIQVMHSEGLLQAPTVYMSDFAEAIENTRPSVGHADLGRFETWDATFGSR